MLASYYVVDVCKELKETMHVHGKHLSQAPLLIYFNFFPKVFFPKLELPNSRCGLSASTAYMPVFTVYNTQQTQLSPCVTHGDNSEIQNALVSKPSMLLSFKIAN